MSTRQTIIVVIVLIYISVYTYKSRVGTEASNAFELEGVFFVSPYSEDENFEEVARFVFWPANFVDRAVFGGPMYGSYPTTTIGVQSAE